MRCMLHGRITIYKLFRSKSFMKLKQAPVLLSVEDKRRLAHFFVLLFNVDKRVHPHGVKKAKKSKSKISADIGSRIGEPLLFFYNFLIFLFKPTRLHVNLFSNAHYNM